MTDDPVWGNRFHWCALTAGILAVSEGRFADSRYVKKLAYELYESGAFRDRPTPSGSTPSSSR
jgi:hypothetical protein